MNDFAQFKKAVKNRVQTFMPDQYQTAEVTIEKVLKNNGHEEDKLVIREEGQTIAPAVYLRPYYDEMILAGTSMEESIRHIAQDYVMHDRDMKRNLPESVKDILTDYGQVRDRLQIQLVNAEQNAELLEGTAHKKLENTDLAAVFRIRFDEILMKSASMLVPEGLLETWKTDVETLYDHALENSANKFPYIFMALPQPVLPEPENGSLYLLTNSLEQYGTSVLLYPEVMQTLAQDHQTNFFILPSSVHELVLIADNGQQDIQQLQEMVIKVNRSMLSLEERLSDQVYYYDRTSQDLSMVTTPEGTRQLLRELSLDGCGQNGMELGEYAEPEQEMEL